jgi:prolipoprotein diacylglyceryltransferase
MLYTIGRGFIEMLRTDEATYVLGFASTSWTSVIVFAGAAFAFWRFGVRAGSASAVVGPPTGSQKPAVTAR